MKINMKLIIVIAAAVLLIGIRGATHADTQKTLSFAISPMASPVSTLKNFGKLIDYLAEKTGMQIEIKQRRKYAEINDLLRSGESHFALTCTGAFLSGKYDFQLELFAVPVVNGRTSYNSYIIVKKGSGIRNFDQLRGKVFAFTDPLSLSGRLYPLYLLHNIRTTPEEYFRESFFTSSHEKSIESVAYGIADGAAVDSLIFDGMKKGGSKVTEDIEIIHVSPPYGIPPIVVSPLTDVATRRSILDALLQMAETGQGREVLDAIGIDEFILPNPALYYNAVRLRNALMSR